LTPKELEDEVEAAGAEVTEAPKEKAGELELRLEADEDNVKVEAAVDEEEAPKTKEEEAPKTPLVEAADVSDFVALVPKEKPDEEVALDDIDAESGLLSAEKVNDAVIGAVPPAGATPPKLKVDEGALDVAGAAVAGFDISTAAPRPSAASSASSSLLPVDSKPTSTFLSGNTKPVVTQPFFAASAAFAATTDGTGAAACDFDAAGVVEVVAAIRPSAASSASSSLLPVDSKPTSFFSSSFGNTKPVVTQPFLAASAAAAFALIAGATGFVVGSAGAGVSLAAGFTPTSGFTPNEKPVAVLVVRALASAAGAFVPNTKPEEPLDPVVAGAEEPNLKPPEAAELASAEPNWIAGSPGATLSPASDAAPGLGSSHDMHLILASALLRVMHFSQSHSPFLGLNISHNDAEEVLVPFPFVSVVLPPLLCEDLAAPVTTGSASPSSESVRSRGSVNTKVLFDFELLSILAPIPMFVFTIN
jgi:hypothetical protein